MYFLIITNCKRLSYSYEHMKKLLHRIINPNTEFVNKKTHIIQNEWSTLVTKLAAKKN